MMDTLFNASLAGTFLVLCGIFGFTRHFLLEPGMMNYPKAPQWLLYVFFAFACVCLFLGLRYWAAVYEGETTIPPAASPAMVMMSGALLVYKASMLINVLRQRYPADTWKRLNRIADLARCSTRA